MGFGGQWGGYTDMETGLVLMGHRYYSPYYGRFISRDPIGYDGGINLYAYADNNPITHADPSGLNWLTEHAKAFGRWVGRKTRAVGNGLCDLIKAPFIAGMKMDYKKQPSLQMAYRGFDIADEVNGRYARAGHAINDYVEDTGGMIVSVIIPGGASRASFEQAMNQALEWLGERGFVAESETLSRGLGDSEAGVPIGMQTEDGKVGYRVEFDERNGAHINVWNGKEKGPHFIFNATQTTVRRIIRRYRR